MPIYTIESEKKSVYSLVNSFYVNNEFNECFDIYKKLNTIQRQIAIEGIGKNKNIELASFLLHRINENN